MISNNIIYSSVKKISNNMKEFNLHRVFSFWVGNNCSTHLIKSSLTNRVIDIVSLLINVIDFDLFIPIYIIRLYVVMIQLLSNSINGTILLKL